MANQRDTSTTDAVRSQVEPHLHTMREHFPDRRQVQGALSWLVIGLAPFILGVAVLTVGGVLLSGGAFALAVATPIFIVFSPVLVPLGAVLVIMFVAAAMGVAALAVMLWLYRYLKGDEPIYYDRVDAARNRIAGTAHEVKGWAMDHVPRVDQQAAPSA
ncbi:unnamed protein product [Calypogeia fissa]